MYRLALALVASLALSALPPAAIAQAPTPVRVLSFTRDAAVDAGIALGYFAAVGLDVTQDVTPNSTFQMQSLAAGDVDIVTTSFDNVLAWSRRDGGPRMWAFAPSQTPSSFALSLYAIQQVHDWADLRGKRVAVDAPDTAFALIARKLLLTHGLDLAKGDYQFVAVGSTQLRLQALESGDAEAGMLSPPYDARAEQQGMHALGGVRDIYASYPGSVVAVSTWAQTHPAELVAFTAARHRALEWLWAHPDDALPLLLDALGTADAASVQASLDRMPAPTETLDPEGLAAVLELRKQFGPLPPAGTDLDAYILDVAGLGGPETPSIVPAPVQLPVR